MNIYIDFDGTLFDTNRFYNDFLLLCEKYNVNKKDIIKPKGLFNLDNLALQLKIKYNLNNSFIKETNKLYNPSYLYKDSISFLKKYYKKYNLNILTFGDYEYQLKKINCCKFKKYFKRIIITEDKTKEDIDYKNSIFIDNSPKDLKKLMSVGATNLIRIKHDDDPYSKESSLSDINEYFALNDIDML